jgi:hypothetical protein
METNKEYDTPWRVEYASKAKKQVDREKRNIEIRFVGPHGSVDYSRFK